MKNRLVQEGLLVGVCCLLVACDGGGGTGGSASGSDTDGGSSGTGGATGGVFSCEDAESLLNESDPAEVGEWGPPIEWSQQLGDPGGHGDLIGVHTMHLPGKILMYSGFGNPKDDQYLYDLETKSFTHVPLNLDRSSCVFDSDIDCKATEECEKYCAGATNSACPDPGAAQSEFECVTETSTPDLFCSGHTHWIDGTAVVQGGNATGSSSGGGPRAVYELVDEIWSFLTLLNPVQGRWYPSLTTLHDGRIVLHGGDFANNSITVWDRLGGGSNVLTSHPVDAIDPTGRFFYPFTFQMTDGRLFVGGQEGAGPLFDDGWIFDPDTLQYEGPIDSQIPGGSAVMYEPDRVMKSGGCAGAGSRCIPSDETEMIDLSMASPTWDDSCPMPQRRHFQTLTMLPDGTVLMTGGNREGNGDPNRTFYCREPDGNFTLDECETASDCCTGADSGSGGGCSETCEEWDNTFYATRSAALWWPWSGHWLEFGEQVHERMYHSTAILVPDGRVLSAGNGQRSQLVNQTEVEFFSPPYKFWGPAPEIVSAPSDADYGTSILVDVALDGEAAPAAEIHRVTLVRLGSVTHQFDMDQRFVELEFSQVPSDPDTISVTMPGGGEQMPPGWNMLFILTDRDVPQKFLDLAGLTGAPNPGVPSEGHYLRLNLE